MNLIPSFGGLPMTVLAFVVALSIIVFVHEFGHYIVGRWCGIRADVFSLGFGPVLWSRTDRRGTVWQIAALPFGGYVKFAGDADAASGRDDDALAEMEAADLSHTMHGAALWARTLTVAAGPVFNFILSIAIFAAMIWAGGLATGAPTVGALKPVPYAEMPLRPGDVLISVNGTAVPDYETLYDLGVDGAATDPAAYVVLRDNRQVEFTGPFPFPPLVDTIYPQSAAYDAGLTGGDVVLSANGVPISTFRDLKRQIEAADGAPIALKVWRAGRTLDITLTPKTVDIPSKDGGWEKRSMIGVVGGLIFEPLTETPGVFEALGRGVEQTWDIITRSLDGLWHIIRGAISRCNLQSPIGIAQAAGAAASQGADDFIWFIAVLSTAVGLLNLFPIPVLDGGHLVFFGYEAIFRRPPSERALKILMTLGLGLLLSLMLFALSNDLFCP
jgi:regulator of sigma E protease